MGWNVKQRQRYALIEEDEVDSQKHRGTFYIGPRHVKHHSTKQFVEFSHQLNPAFASEPDCRAFAQNSHIAVELYDDKAYLFDPDYERKICRETWTPQAKIAGEWVSLDTTVISRSKEDLADGVKFTANYDVYYNASKIGSLQISYIFRTGAFLKHEITATNLTAKTRTLRIVQTLIGIAGKKIVHALGEDEVTVTEKERLARFIRFVDKDNPKFQYLHENLQSLGHYEQVDGEPTWINDYLKGLRLKLVNYEGKQLVRCDIVIGNYTLDEYESFLIDPASDTWQVGASGNDVIDKGTAGDLSGATADEAFTTNEDHVPAGYQYTGWAKTHLYSALRWTGVNIPQGSTITSAHLVIKAKDKHKTNDQNSETRIYGEDADNPSAITSHSDFRARTRTTAYANWDFTDTWTQDTWYSTEDYGKNITNIIQEIVNRPGYGEDALTLFWGWRTTVSGHVLRTGYSYDGTAANAAELEATWSTAGLSIPVAMHAYRNLRET